MRSEKVKILFIQNILAHYRIPLYNYLQETYADITVLHSGEVVSNDLKFKEVILESKSYKGFYYNFGFYKKLKEYDYVVGMYDLRWLNIWLIPFVRPSVKFVFWGIGVSTEKGFDSDTSKDKYRFLIGKKADAMVFYSEYPIQKYINAGFDKRKLFVAHNTIHSTNKFNLENRTYSKFLFIGSITHRKKIIELIEIFKSILSKIPKHITLEIVGDGPFKEFVSTYLDQEELSSRVIVKPGFYGSDKTSIFTDAIATISLGQAGLSVLESFAYGVPFITYGNAITGGERLNIVNGCNGFLINDDNQLIDIMIKMANANFDLRLLSLKSREYYQTKRKIANMGDGFIKAFEYLREDS